MIYMWLVMVWAVFISGMVQVWIQGDEDGWIPITIAMFLLMVTGGAYCG